MDAVMTGNLHDDDDGISGDFRADGQRSRLLRLLSMSSSTAVDYQLRGTYTTDDTITAHESLDAAPADSAADAVINQDGIIITESFVTDIGGVLATSDSSQQQTGTMQATRGRFVPRSRNLDTDTLWNTLTNLHPALLVAATSCGATFFPVEQKLW